MNRFQIWLITKEEDGNLEHDTLTLKKELEDLGVDEVIVPVKKDDKGKGGMGDAFSIGILAIAVLPSLLVSLVTFLKDWKLRYQNQSYRIKLKQGENELELDIPRDANEKEIQKVIKIIEKNFPN